MCPGVSQKRSHATLLGLRNKQRDLENQGREEGRGVVRQGASGTAEATDSPITQSAEDTLSLTLTFSPWQPCRAVRRRSLRLPWSEFCEVGCGRRHTFHPWASVLAASHSPLMTQMSTQTLLATRPLSLLSPPSLHLSGALSLPAS